MNKYEIYHNLCNLQTGLVPYADAQRVSEELKSFTDDFSGRNYRVAVIGEFKRGKSSLINSLLGTEILPTDILPTTAVINRIVYSPEQRITIHFKNGEVRESNIESLADYATKLDREKEAFAETIREIVVSYPSVFGQNRVELIDTPGLNDNESMTETTRGVLNRIDTAIVVISAMMPLSMTEQNLICDLLRQEDIYHLTFVVTFIDRVSDDEEEQDRVIELIRRRLKEDTYTYFLACDDDPARREKAARVLLEPAVFAVSSKQAMQGFIRGNNGLIEKSRFPHFKLGLFALLTANQEKDRQYKIERICAQIRQQLPAWTVCRQTRAEESVSRAETKAAALKRLAETAGSALNAELIAMNVRVSEDEGELMRMLFGDADLAQGLRKIYVAHLSVLRRDSYSVQTLLAAMEAATEEANAALRLYTERRSARLVARIAESVEAILCLFAPMHEAEKISLSADALSPKDTEPPSCVLSVGDIMGRMHGLYDECILRIDAAIGEALKEYTRAVQAYIAGWRVLVLRFGETAERKIPRLLELAGEEIAAARSAAEADKQREVQEREQLLSTVGNLLAVACPREE